MHLHRPGREADCAAQLEVQLSQLLACMWDPATWRSLAASLSSLHVLPHRSTGSHCTRAARWASIASMWSQCSLLTSEAPKLAANNLAIVSQRPKVS